jgi:hypothetical protein
MKLLRSIAFVAACVVALSSRAYAGTTFVVSTVEELKSAMASADPGSKVLVRSGTYLVAETLHVPDGITLVGESRMRYVDGRPVGLDPATASWIKATTAFAGEVLSLGDEVVVRRLGVESAAGVAPNYGNVIGARSRKAGDWVSVTIAESQLVNPNPAGVSFGAPIGRSLFFISQDPEQGNPPTPHVGSTIEARIRDCFVQAPAAGSAVLAINFASESRIDVVLDNNNFQGNLDASGGTSRPALTSNSSTTIRSRRTVWSHPDPQNASPNAIGFLIVGGSTAPVGTTAGGVSNTTYIVSTDDRIEGFPIAVRAIAGRRFNPGSGMCHHNTIDLRLSDTVIQTPDTPTAADFHVAAAQSDLSGGNSEYVPGNGNTLRFQASGIRASGPRANVFADVRGPVNEGNFGSNNALEVAGTPEHFATVNTGVEPPPAPEFFDGGTSD